jgi:hypothetical protein
MRFRSTKASGSFDCTKRGAFELLVHMEADPHCWSYAQFDFTAVLPSDIACELDDVAAYMLRHTAGRYVVCAQLPKADRSPTLRYCWNELDTKLASQDTWLLSATLKELRSQPRWSAALQIARAAQNHIDPSDHERVVAHISTVGPARLRDCLRLCGSGRDSFDALLGLVSSGILFLDPPDDLSLDGELRLEPKTYDTTISWLPRHPADHVATR